MSDRVDTEALAAVLDRADDRWQHGIGAGGYDPDGPPLWLAAAVLASDWLAARDARVRAEMVERIKEFDFSDDYHQGDDPEGRYYAGIDRACRLVLGDIATWTDPRPVGEGTL